MADHINRWLLAAASAYLFLLPTNAATFAVSVAFGIAALCALAALVVASRDPATRLPLAGASLLVPLAVWVLWSSASLAWSVDPAYSRGQLAREVMDSVATMGIFYVAARDAHALRVLIATALASLAFFALAALGIDFFAGPWDAGRFHHGVGAYATWLVLAAPFLFALIAPPPSGFGGGARMLFAGLLLLALVIASARLTDNRIVWIALAAVFATASLVAALRWPQAFARSPIRSFAPLAVLLLVLGLAFNDVLEERAAVAPQNSVALSLERDPRIALWERVSAHIAARPWLGYGFGRKIIAPELTRETGNPLLSHAHDVFASQWLQTGVVGMGAFIAFLAALAARYLRFARARDDSLAFVGVLGLALLAGFVAKNLTDDFLFRSNAKELWAMTASLLGYGVRRERALADAERTLVAQANADPLSDASAREGAAGRSPPRRRSESA